MVGCCFGSFSRISVLSVFGPLLILGFLYSTGLTVFCLTIILRFGRINLELDSSYGDACSVRIRFSLQWRESGLLVSPLLSDLLFEPSTDIGSL